MKNENLFKGIGMVVDDQVNSGEDKAIDGIVKYRECKLNCVKLQ